MKLLIASDLHGSTTYIKKLIDRINEEKPEGVILLGDILYHGPRNALPNEYDTEEAARLINSKSELITCVRGNCDSDADATILDFSIELENIIISSDGINMFVTHGDYYNIGNLPAIASFDVLLHGHTHVPACQELAEGKYYINPGSVSIPKSNSEHSYLMYENRKFVWKDIDGVEYMSKQL